MSDLVQYTLRGPAAVITLDRPENGIALAAATHRAHPTATALLAQRTYDLPPPPRPRGGGASSSPATARRFCAGMDLDELRDTLGPDSDKVLGRCNATLRALRTHLHAAETDHRRGERGGGRRRRRADDRMRPRGERPGREDRLPGVSSRVGRGNGDAATCCGTSGNAPQGGCSSPATSSTDWPRSASGW